MLDVCILWQIARLVFFLYDLNGLEKWRRESGLSFAEEYFVIRVFFVTGFDVVFDHIKLLFTVINFTELKLTLVEAISVLG